MIAAPELPDGLGMDDLTAEKRDSTPVAAAVHKPGKGRADDVPRGILCMIVATVLFSAASAARKWLVFRGLRRQEMAGRNQIQSARCYACVRWPPSLPAPQ